MRNIVVSAKTASLLFKRIELIASRSCRTHKCQCTQLKCKSYSSYGPSLTQNSAENSNFMANVIEVPKKGTVICNINTRDGGKRDSCKFFRLQNFLFRHPIEENLKKPAMVVYVFKCFLFVYIFHHQLPCLICKTERSSLINIFFLQNISISYTLTCRKRKWCIQF